MSESFLRNVQNDDNSEEKDSSLGCLSQKNAKFMHPKRVNHTYTNRGAPHDTFLAKETRVCAHNYDCWSRTNAC